MEINILYFPPKDGDKSLGGGFVTCGFLKTRFTVYESDKTESGISVRLPSKKKDDGTWDNIVTTPSRDAQNTLEQAVLQKMSNAGITVGGNSSPNSAPTTAQSTPKTVVKANGSGIPKKIPF